MAFEIRSGETEPGPVPANLVRPHFRSAGFVFFAHDGKNFSALLRTHFPEAAFLSWKGGTTTQLAGLEVRLHDSFAEIQGSAMMSFFPPDWRPRFRAYKEDQWVLSNLPWPYATVLKSPPVRSTSVRGVEVEAVARGELSVACFPGRKDHLSIARKVLRLLHHPLVGSTQVGAVEFPSLQVANPVHPGAFGISSFGLHALEWSRGAPNRVLGFEMYPSGHAFGYRPLAGAAG